MGAQKGCLPRPQPRRHQRCFWEEIGGKGTQAGAGWYISHPVAIISFLVLLPILTVNS